MSDMETHVWELGDFREIELESAAYPLDVQTVDPGEAPRLEMRARGKKPNVEIDRSGDRVRVAIDWDEGDIFGWLRWGRPARMTLHLPKGVRGRVAIGAGNVRIGVLDCEDLQVETGAGSIHAGRVTGRVALETSAGSIHVGELDGGIVARTNAGSIRVRILGLDPGTHTVHSEAGAVRVDVAEGLVLHVVPQVTFGHAKIEVRDTAGAAAVLEVGSSAGSVAVRPWAGMHGMPQKVVEVGPYRTPSPVTKPEKKEPGELERILEMVADGRLTPDQAGELIAALDS
jgi:hypothetical protein